MKNSNSNSNSSASPTFYYYYTIIVKHMYTTTSSSLASLISFFIFHANPFWIELFYFLSISLLGFLSLKSTKPTSYYNSLPLKNIDLFYTSSSAVTLSSLSTVDMETFSNPQLILIIFLMFAGGEVFTSLLTLQLAKFRIMRNGSDSRMLTNYGDGGDSIELGGRVSDHPSPNFKEQISTTTANKTLDGENGGVDVIAVKLKLISSLSTVVSCFLFLVHLLGSIAISLYLVATPSARRVLAGKGLHLGTFSIFTTVSSFANCGFLPNNENMAVFKKNSGLLLLVAPQILMGNTFYPVCLRGVIWIAEKITGKKELRYLLENSRELGYGHLLTGTRTAYLGATGLSFLVLQLATFCFMEWNSPATAGGGGLSGYQKLVGSFFQVVNSRHAGESVFDLASISSAVLVLIVLMMYLPPYTTFLPVEDNDTSITTTNDGTQHTKKPKRDTRGLWENIMFSQLTCLTIFVILICITEQHAMRRDPVNFSVLNVVFEVISAYGNVGFSTGYSCARQIMPDGHCVDASYGFSGRWTSQGKFVLIIVMFFGRLKKYSMNGGRAWNLQ